MTKKALFGQKVTEAAWSLFDRDPPDASRFGKNAIFAKNHVFAKNAMRQGRRPKKPTGEGLKLTPKNLTPNGQK